MAPRVRRRGRSLLPSVLAASSVGTDEWLRPRDTSFGRKGSPARGGVSHFARRRSDSHLFSEFLCKRRARATRFRNCPLSCATGALLDIDWRPPLFQGIPTILHLHL